MKTVEYVVQNNGGAGRFIFKLPTEVDESLVFDWDKVRLFDRLLFECHIIFTVPLDA